MVGLLSLMIFMPILSSPLVYLIGIRDEKASRIATLGISGLTVVLSLLAYGSYDVSVGGYQLVEVRDWAPSFGLSYIVAVDGISLPLVIISALLTLLATAGSWELITFRVAEYHALMLLFLGAMIGTFTALNLVLFYLFWELVLVPMFLFIGVWGGPNKRYAAMKFLIFTHLGSTVMLLGFIALYILSTPHSFNFFSLIQRRPPVELQILVAAATFFGYAVKLPVVPLHTWLPDAHVEAPAPVSVLLAGLLLKMGGYGFIRFILELLPEASKALSTLFVALGLLTMFYGALVSMIQQDIKRMIALTSINHMGYVLLGSFTLSGFGVNGAVFQMFNHANAIGILFLMSGFIHEHAGTRVINELRGLNHVMPKTAVLLVLGSLGAMAFPGFASFISEAMVILAGISVNPVYAVAVGAPAITAGYFMWTLRRVIYTGSMQQVVKNDAPWHALVTLSSFLVPLFVLGLFPAPLLAVIAPSTDRLVRAVGSVRL